MDVDSRREYLLDCGVRLFASRGYDEVAIDGIARACGVSRALLYHYFEGKREYYVATVAHAARRIRAVEPELNLRPTEQLRIGLERYFASIEDNADAHAVLRRAVASDAQAASIVEAEREAFSRRVLLALPFAAEQSVLLSITARAWVGAVESAAWAWIDAGRRGAQRDEIVAVLAEALVAAVLAAARLDPSIELRPEIAAAVGDGVFTAVVGAKISQPAGD